MITVLQKMMIELCKKVNVFGERPRLAYWIVKDERLMKNEEQLLTEKMRKVNLLKIIQSDYSTLLVGQ